MPRTKSNPIQVQKFLAGMEYPAKKDDLIKHAQKKGADNEIISLLKGMKENEFKSPAEVSKAIGEQE